MENMETFCPVSTVINLIGGKYKSLILWNLIEGELRFSQLQKIVENATAKMLTQQLRELEEDGLVIRTVYPVIPPKVEYSLAEKGKQVIPILQMMYKVGEDMLSEQGKCPNCKMKRLL